MRPNAMRKQLKNKRRCCGLCKPHKRGLENRWKPRAKQVALESAREVEAEMKGFNHGRLL